MNLNKIIATAALLAISASASARGAIVDDGEKVKEFGSGAKSCKIVCAATCGKGIESDTFVGAEVVVGYGDDSTKAFNSAVKGCSGFVSFGACGLGSQFDTAVVKQMIVGDVPLIRRTNEAGVSSKSLVVNQKNAVSANVENCAVSDKK